MNWTVSTRNVMLSAIVIVVAICPGVFGQVSLTPGGRPFLTSAQLTASAGTEGTAAAIVAEALASYVSFHPNTTMTVIGTQIPENWLPVVPGAQFIRITDDAARAHLQQCGKLLSIESFTMLTSDEAAISIAEGSRCASVGSNLRFNRSSDGWHLETSGVPGGFASGASECSCK